MSKMFIGTCVKPIVKIDDEIKQYFEDELWMMKNFILGAFEVAISSGYLFLKHILQTDH